MPLFLKIMKQCGRGSRVPELVSKNIRMLPFGWRSNPSNAHKTPPMRANSDDAHKMHRVKYRRSL